MVIWTTGGWTISRGCFQTCAQSMVQSARGRSFLGINECIYRLQLSYGSAVSEGWAFGQAVTKHSKVCMCDSIKIIEK